MFVDATGAASALLCFVAISSDDDRFNKFAVYISETDIAVNNSKYTPIYYVVSGMQQACSKASNVNGSYLFSTCLRSSFTTGGFGFQASDGSRVYTTILHPT